MRRKVYMVIIVLMLTVTMLNIACLKGISARPALLHVNAGAHTQSSPIPVTDNVTDVVSIKLDKDTIDFGNVSHSQESDVKTVVVSNIGTVDFGVTIEIEGADAIAQQFYEQSLYIGNHLYDRERAITNVPVAKSQSIGMQLEVPSTWSDYGTHNAMFIFWAEPDETPFYPSNASLIAVTIIVIPGVGIELGQSAIHYGDVRPGKSSEVETIDITNTGDIYTEVMLRIEGATNTAQQFFEQSLYVGGSPYDGNLPFAVIAPGQTINIGTQLRVPSSWSMSGAQDATFIFLTEPQFTTKENNEGGDM